MIDKKLLRLFCSNDEYIPALKNPFNIGKYTYACNRYIGIRVPRIAEYDKNEVVDSMAKLSFGDDVNASLFVEIPKTDELCHLAKCLACEGTGKITECPECYGEGNVEWTSPGGYDYEAECKRCNGDIKISGGDSFCSNCAGTGNKTEFKYFPIGSKYVNGSLLQIVQQLPGVRLAIEISGKLSAMPFRFDGGAGILMPARKLKD
jgi:hypothetical protein